MAQRSLVTRTPPALSESEVLADTAADTGSAARPDQPSGRRKQVDAWVEQIAKRYSSDRPLLLPRLEDQLRRRLGLAPLSASSAVLSGLVPEMIIPCSSSISR